ncbi:MAG: response regulator transcription factor, partial [Thermoleophilia bacterium]|nr:response regulator transcription factor [Thermoleophilia bacterium]
MATVLVVDDEPIVREVVVRYLVREGHETLEAADGNAARDAIEREEPDLVVLDVMLPGTDGLELCRWIRARSELPVIMLTARGEEADRIVGLELGADDYVTKPFSPRELAARVRSVLRRSAPAQHSDERLTFGDIVLERATREARKGGGEVRLTAKEFDLLWFLASHPRR